MPVLQVAAVVASSSSSNRTLAEEDMNSLLHNCSFVIYPPEAEEDNVYPDSLYRVIQDHGGQVEKLAGPNSITLLDLYYMRDKDLKVSPKDNLPKHDLFTSRFIYEAIEAKQLTDLNQCRFLHSSFEDYDANDILLGRRTWDSLTRLTQKAKAQAALARKAIIMAKHKAGFGATVPNNPTATMPLANPKRQRNFECSTGENVEFGGRSNEDIQVPLAVRTATASPKKTVAVSIVSNVERTVDPVPRAQPATSALPSERPSAQQVQAQQAASQRHSTSASSAQPDANPPAPVRQREGSVSPIQDISLIDLSGDSDDGGISNQQKMTTQIIRSRNFVPSRSKFSYQEDKKLLQILLDNNWHLQYSALEPYKWIERHSELRRTHMSLRNRVVRHLIKNLHKYDLKQEDIEKFEEGKRELQLKYERRGPTTVRKP